MSDQRSAPPRIGALGDRYRIGREIGSGGMARVFLATDTLLGRQVAIKVFRARADTPEELRAQENEAKLVASMNHHALTTLFDAGVDASDPAHPQIFLVMEYVEGSDLKRRLQRGAMDPMQVAYLGFDLAEGLDYVHEHGFLHRDIKPANVLLAQRREDSRLRGKLADFGIASIIGRGDGSEYTTGTAAYLSPEQVEGRDALPASDTYALGLVLLEAVTGRVAFPGSVTESALARLDVDPGIPDSVPEPLADVLRGMTARDLPSRIGLAEAADAFEGILVDGLSSRRPATATAPVAVQRDTEEERLAALARYSILDTPPEDAFDAVTRIAARLLGVPIALVSIVDRDRVWFKSRRGFAEPEVDRGVAFCSTTDEGTGTWSIPDALADPRTRANPLVTHDPHVRSYAAAPLITFDGHSLGALCVFDRRPREFSRQELSDLTDLAGIVMRELELRLASRRALFDR